MAGGDFAEREYKVAVVFVTTRETESSESESSSGKLNWSTTGEVSQVRRENGSHA